MTDSPENVVPLRDAGVAQYTDSFINLLAGLGVQGRDKFESQTYTFNRMSNLDLENAYRGDWIARKAVTIPAWDMTREWRHWNADPDQITLIETLEKKVFLQQKMQQALIKARLYGGAAILVGVDVGRPEEELDLELVTTDSLKFLHVMSRNQIRTGPIIADISSKYFGLPEYYEASSTPVGKGFQQKFEETPPRDYTKAQVRVHPSRVVRLIGVDTADQMLTEIWGDSVLQSVNDAVRMCGLVTGSLATLISELKIDIIKIPELKSILSTEAGTKKMMARFSAANVAKSVVNTILIDGNEEWQRIEAPIGRGVSDILMSYLQIAAGATDIPSTRFLGMSPQGFQATGESDTRNYYDRLASEQKVTLEPAINVLDEVLIRSALGEHPPEIWYDWNPLWQLTAAEKADVGLKKAQIYQVDVTAAQLPPTVLAKARANQLIEDGIYPGLESVLEDAETEGDTIEAQNEPVPMPPAMEAQQGLPPPGQPGGPPPGPGQVPGQPPPRGNGGGNVVQLQVKPQKDGTFVFDFNQCHNEHGETGGEFCSEEGGGGGGKETGQKGEGGDKKKKGAAEAEHGKAKGSKEAKPPGKNAPSALQKLGHAIGQAAKALAHGGKGDKPAGKKAEPAKKAEKPKAEKPSKPEKQAKPEKPSKPEKPDKSSERTQKAAEREQAKGEKQAAREGKQAEREKAKGAKQAERAGKKSEAEQQRAEKKSAAEKQRAQKQAEARRKQAEREQAKQERQAEKEKQAKEKQAKQPKEKQAKPEKPPKETSKSKASKQQGKGEGGGAGGKGKGSGGKGKQPKAPKGKQAKQAQPKAPKQAQPKQSQPKAPAAKGEGGKGTQKPSSEVKTERQIAELQQLLSQEISPQAREQLQQRLEELKRRLRDGRGGGNNGGSRALVVHYGDTANPQLCDQCGGYHLCSVCGGALFDHNMCHGPDGKFCSDPSGGPTRAEQRKERAYERAAKSAMGGGAGKGWNFPHEPKPKGKYESPAEAVARGERNRKREREALQHEYERRIGETLAREMHSPNKSTAEQAAVEAAVGIGKAAQWAYGKLRKSKAAAPKPVAAPSAKRGPGRPRTRPLGPKRPRGRPRKS